MAAVFREQIATGFDSVEQMKSANRAARTMGLPVFGRNNERRAAIAFDHARSSDTDDAAMPALALDHRAICSAESRIIVEPFDDRGQNLVFGVLAIGVELVEAPGDVASLGGILGGKEFDDGARDIHAASSIDSWPNPEADISGGEWALAVELGHIEQSFESSINGLA